MQFVFDVRSIGLMQWLFIFFIAVGVFVIVEIEKWVLRYFYKIRK